MSMKVCSTCKTAKPSTPEFFHRHRKNKDGLCCQCKTCRRKLRPQNRGAYREQMREYRRRNRARKQAYNRRYYQRYPERYRAERAVNRAVKKGELPPISECRCVLCEKPAHHYHHHYGYDEAHRLDVVPVCASCHKHLERTGVA